jgi:hypothetical protein
MGHVRRNSTFSENAATRAKGIKARTGGVCQRERRNTSRQAEPKPAS